MQPIIESDLGLHSSWEPPLLQLAIFDLRETFYSGALRVVIRPIMFLLPYSIQQFITYST